MTNNISTEGFNRLTGFIEVYPKDTTFANTMPYKVLVEETDSSISYNFGNGSSVNPILERMPLLNKVSIKESFKTLTDTCEIVVPRFDDLIIRDARNINNFSVFDTSSDDIDLVFGRGNVVRVFLGYDDVDELMFHGYISEATATAPIKIKCEDAMWRLKQKVINKVFRPTGGRKEVRLEDFIHEILDGTGVQLAEHVLTEEVTFGKTVTFRNSTVARIMDDIKKRGLSVFMELGRLVIGRTYFDATLTPHVSTKSNPAYKPPLIDTEWNVPKGGNKLVASNMNKKTNMVTVQKFIGNDRIIQLNVTLDPNKSEDVFAPVQISDSNNKDDADAARHLDSWLQRKYWVKVDTTGYSQHTATMDSERAYKPKVGESTVDSEWFSELVESMFSHGKDMYFKYFDNGLSGQITVFGDYGLHSAQSIELLDKNNPETDGEYLITSVSTEWGFGGYRQTVSIGIKIKDSIKYIGDIPAENAFEGSSEFSQEYDKNRTA